MLSHESKAVLEFTRRGQLLKSFSIEVTQAEGITKDNKGYIYIICEATGNLYVYAPEVVPTSAPATLAPQATAEKVESKGTSQPAPAKHKVSDGKE